MSLASPETPEQPQQQPERHRPKHAAAPAAVGYQPFLAPGLRAWAAQHPHRWRHGALAAVAGGMALFAAVAMSDAATPASHPSGAAAHVRPVGLPLASAPAIPALQVAGTPAPASAPATAAAAVQAVPATKQAPADAAVISGLAANGIPKVALNAYRVAAARMAHDDPSCGIDWALLAGIGREESDHGQFGGAVLHADGISTPKIIGPALDGKHWDYIAAPSNGMALDGDAVYAHALGPMQFIPQTWASYGADADGDGVANIFDINDAALGAARYLCAAGGDLRTRGGQIAAVLAYNHNDTYLAQVLALADAYRRGLDVTGIPLVGNITGSLPPVTSGGPTLAANPGAPMAGDPGTHRARRAHTSGSRSTHKARSGSSGSSGTGSTSGSGTHHHSGGTGSTGGSSSGSGAGGASQPTQPAPTPAPSVPLPLPSLPKLPLPTASSTPAPTSSSPSPSPTCQVGLGGVCLLGG